MCIKVAELLGLVPDYVMACVHAERAKRTDVKRVWERVAKRAAAGTAAALVLGISLAATYAAFVLVQQVIEGFLPPGTAWAGWRFGRDGRLYAPDLKRGFTPEHIRQLEILLPMFTWSTELRAIIVAGQRAPIEQDRSNQPRELKHARTSL